MEGEERERGMEGRGRGGRGRVGPPITIFLAPALNTLDQLSVDAADAPSASAFKSRKCEITRWDFLWSAPLSPKLLW